MALLGADDRQPFRAGMCCLMIPVTCCGPPVIYAKEPKCCGLVSLAPCCGVPIYYAPTNCFGLKTYLCFGQPCYTSCAAKLVGGLTPEGSDTLLAALSVPQKTPRLLPKNR